MNDPYKYFMIEAHELLENLHRDILDYEKSPDDKALLQRLFRYAHTLKGAAHVVGLLNISKLSHSIEDLFSAARDKAEELTETRISLILKTIDYIRQIVEEVKKGKTEGDFDIEELLAEFEIVFADSGEDRAGLKKAGQDDQAESLSNGREEYPKDPGTARQEDREEPVVDRPQQTETPDTVRVSLSDIDYLMDQASEFVTGTIRMEQLYGSFKTVVAAIGRMASDYRTLDNIVNRFSESGVPVDKYPDELNFLLNKVDVGELHSALAENTILFDANVEEFKQISDSMYQVVHRARSIRVKDIAHYFIGATRDLSVKLNKKISIEITGDDLELDRNLLEEIREPVNQIIRNAAVHGIEEEKERLEKGKDSQGNIRVDFNKRGDFVELTCEDDGRGISAEFMRRTALAKGIIDEKRASEIGNEECIHLIFASGFSSGEIITEFAGRGVGLDIVRDRVESLRGSIAVQTDKDKFTRFIIRLPLSLNMMDAFLVEISGQRFLIPLNMVMETGYVTRDEIEHVAGRSVIRLDNSPVSLEMLSDALGLNHRHENGKKRPYVLLRSGHEVRAFLVDRIAGVRRIIIKELGEQLADVKNVIGGAILSDGLPAPVLNIPALFHSSMVGPLKVEVTEGESLLATISTILVVDDSLTSRVLMNGILESEGYDVTLATSAEDALVKFSEGTFDLIISDVEMPGLNGFELTEKIRQAPEHNTVPVIIVSSLSKDEYKRRGIEVGAQAYIVKGGFDQEIFLETVGRLID